jgi:TPR repeat protein
MYGTGRGVPRDESEAATWFRRAAEQNHAGAQYNLGAMHDHGRGVAQNDHEAANWYRAAAARGHASAQYNVGLMFENGTGVPQNYVEAHKWLALAAARFPDERADLRDLALTRLAAIAAQMTAAEVLHAEQLARDWHPK